MREKWAGTFVMNPFVIEPEELVPGDKLGYKIIASVGQAGFDWAAYFGPTTWTDAQICNNGDKLRESQATALFPTLAEKLKYRG